MENADRIEVVRSELKEVTKQTESWRSTNKITVESVRDAEKKGRKAEVPTLCRRLSKRSIGPKKKKMISQHKFSHRFKSGKNIWNKKGKTEDVWQTEVQNVTDKWRQFSFLRPAYFTLDEIASERALDDFERIKANTLDASLGRTSPPWSAPLELYRVMLHPDRDIDESRAGIGNDKTPIEAKECERWFRQLFYTVRKKNQAPWFWHRSYTIPLEKPGNKTGTQAVRLVYIF